MRREQLKQEETKKLEAKSGGARFLAANAGFFYVKQAASDTSPTEMRSSFELTTHTSTHKRSHTMMGVSHNEGL